MCKTTTYFIQFFSRSTSTALNRYLRLTKKLIFEVSNDHIFLSKNPENTTLAREGNLAAMSNITKNSACTIFNQTNLVNYLTPKANIPNKQPFRFTSKTKFYSNNSLLPSTKPLRSRKVSK